MIHLQSRYADATVKVVEDSARGPHQAVIVSPPGSRVYSFTYYQIRGSEQIDQLSSRYYGQGNLWWKIADANPEILDWTSLEPGRIIRIPNG